MVGSLHSTDKRTSVCSGMYWLAMVISFSTNLQLSVSLNPPKVMSMEMGDSSRIACKLIPISLEYCLAIACGSDVMFQPCFRRFSLTLIAVPKARSVSFVSKIGLKEMVPPVKVLLYPEDIDANAKHWSNVLGM